MTWEPLTPGTPMRNGVKVELEDEELWLNDQYVVHKRVMQSDNPENPPMIHLSIRNEDRSARHDWRDFQRIKNQLAGPEWEAVEIYPAESRLVDGANQYHLWCLPFSLGIGFPRRLVMTQARSEEVFPQAKGSVQRDPEEVDLQYGGLTTIEDAHAASNMDYYKTVGEEDV